jgi:hypothetical protein
MKNEPVAWLLKENPQVEGEVIPLYTHPVKELTDEEICKIFNEHTGLGIHQKEADKADLLVFARAILRKAQEKC